MQTAFRSAPDPGPLLVDDAAIRLGGLRRGSQLEVLLQFIVPPHPVGRQWLARLVFMADVLGVQRIDERLSNDLAVQVALNAPEEAPPVAIVDALSKLTLYRLQEKARAEAFAGDTRQATQSLERLASRLLASGEKGLAKTALVEAQRLARTRKISDEGQKTLKFGTRALIRPAQEDSVIRCPVCKHEEYEGTLYCSECGNQLWEGSPKPAEDDDASTTQRFAVSDLAGPARPGQTRPHTDPIIGPSGPNEIMVRVTGHEPPIHLSGRSEYRVGRSDPRHPNTLEFDLAPYHALEMGVSRLHAVIRCSAQAVTLTDLGSTNGTTVNGEALVPNQPQALRDGDELRLGKLALRIFFNLG